ncbi:MAG: type II toxin-antitoxin system CcdA family antitoxin [Candidatus Bathyarchaeia archaeon]
MAKTVCSIYIDAETKAKAHALGLNVSKIAENTLRILIAKLESTDYAKSIQYKKDVKAKEEPTKRQEPEEIF